MDIKSLSLLRSVANLGSFAAAARAESIDPSVVSRTIAALENELGARLFERSTRSLALTEAGEVYLSKVAPLLDELGQAAEDLIDAKESPTGTLRLSASVAYGEAVLVPLVTRFRDRFPSLALDLVLSDDQLDLVAERVDLAIRLAPEPKGELICTKLVSTRYKVVAAASYVAEHGLPASPLELAERECLRFSLPGYRDQWRFRDAGDALLEVEISGPFVISSALAMRRAVLEGVGPALLADWLIGEDLASGRLIDLCPDHEATATAFSTAAWLVYPSRSYTPAKVRAAIGFLKEEIGNQTTGR